MAYIEGIGNINQSYTTVGKMTNSLVANPSQNVQTIRDDRATAGTIASAWHDKATQSYADAISGLQSLSDSFSGTGSSGSNASLDVNKLGSYQDYLTQLGESKETLGGVQSNAQSIYDSLNEKVNSNAENYRTAIGNLSGISANLGDTISDLDALNAKYDPVYDNLNGIDDALSGIADNIGNVIPQYTNQLNDMGNAIYGTGASLVDEGGLFNEQAKALMNMDTSGGGLIAEYINAIQAIDPNQYASMAATDVQKSYQNSMAQQNRELGRSGVDAGSARSVALNQQYAQAQATASAGAKFRARLQGNQERLAAVQQGVTTANSLAETGSSITGAGISAQSTGAGIVGNAGTLALQGAEAQMNAQNARTNVQNQWLSTLAGQLDVQKTKQNVYTAQAGIQKNIADVNSAMNTDYTNAAKVGLESQDTILNAEKEKISGYQNAANMEVNANVQTYSTNVNAKVNAATALADAQIKAAAYYNEQATDWGTLAGTGGLLRGIFGGTGGYGNAYAWTINN